MDPARQFDPPSPQQPPANQPWADPNQQPSPLQPSASRPRPSGGVRAMSIIGIVLGAIALLFLPIVLGPIGIVLGAIAYGKGDKTVGLAALIVASGGMIAGMALGAFVFASGFGA